MQHLCKECKEPVQFHNAEVKWVNGKWDVLTVDEGTAMCDTCGYVCVHEDDDRKEYDVMYTLTATRVKTVKALSAQEAEDIVKNLAEYELWLSSHIELGEPLILQVSEVD